MHKKPTEPQRLLWQKVMDNMTESEAVKKLRAYLKCKAMEVKGIYEDCNNKRCDDCDLCYMQGTTGEHMTAIGIAIQALEKQIPKKPRKTDSYRGVLKRVYAYVCPTCGNACLEKYMNELNNTMFCWNCGQKLDWSDEK